MAANDDYVSGITGHLRLDPDKLRRPEVQLFARPAQTRTARSRSTLSRHLSVGGAYLLCGKQTAAGGRSSASWKHTDVGRIAFHQWLQSDSARGRGSGIPDFDSW